MSAIESDVKRGRLLEFAVVCSALAALSLCVVNGASVSLLAPLFVITAVIAVGHRVLFTWSALLVGLLLVILLIPIARYKLPAGLPFDLEPYRLMVGFVVVGWLLSLLVDPRVRLRASGLERPIALIAVASLASIVVNLGRVAGLGAEVVKTMTFFASFFLVFYLIISVVRTQAGVDRLLRVFVGAGAGIAVLAVIEGRTGYNPFDHLHDIAPFLRTEFIFTEAERRHGSIRAYGPAQHPISLGAALVMMIPIAIYLAHATRRIWWWLAGLVLLIGAVATTSRTGMLMLGVVCLAFLWVRPRHAKRFWPALLPALVAIHFVMPGQLGTLQGMFVPEGGLVAEQRQSAGSRSSSGRVADLAPSLEELSGNPLLGQGFGTRIPTGPGANANLLDDQWLKTTLETGLLGLVGWLWLMGRFIRRAGREAKEDMSQRGWCLSALVVSIAAYAVGMLFYDAFSFIQVTFFFFILLALGCVVRALPRDAEPDRVFGEAA